MLRKSACIAIGSAAVAVVARLLLRRYRRRRRAATTLPCWPDQGLEVRPSLIAGGGDGLFAARAFGEGEVLGEYRGRVLSLHQAHLLENRDYLMGGFGCVSSGPLMNPARQKTPLRLS